MTTHTIALFDITVQDITAERLLERFTNDSSFAADLIEYYRSRWHVATWVIDPSPVNEQPTLVGPGGFTLRWQGYTLELNHMMAFSMFTDDVWCRAALRRACRAIAVSVGSSQVLYTHELMPYEGTDVRTVADWLHAHIGAPARDFMELHAAEYYGSRAWYVETIDTGRMPTHG